MNKFEQARQKYKPEKIKYLLVAETPPKADSNRFFYFERVTKQDSLFIETMKVLYPKLIANNDTPWIRGNKKIFLQRFMQDGFYLIDSLDTPFEERYTTKKKVRLLNRGQEDLLLKIRGLLQTETKVILISVPVFQAHAAYLIRHNIPVINTEPIYFPGSGGQKKYRETMLRLFSKNNSRN